MTKELKRRLRGLLNHHVGILQSVGGSLRTHATNLKSEVDDPLAASVSEAVLAAERDLRNSKRAPRGA